MVSSDARPYLAEHGIPVEPQDLTHHRCCNIRLPTSGDLYAWEFERDGRSVTSTSMAPSFLMTAPAHRCRPSWRGLAFVMEDMGGVVSSPMDAWSGYWRLTPPFSGYHLYYPNRPPPVPGVHCASGGTTGQLLSISRAGITTSNIQAGVVLRWYLAHLTSIRTGLTGASSATSGDARWPTDAEDQDQIGAWINLPYPNRAVARQKSRFFRNSLFGWLAEKEIQIPKDRFCAIAVVRRTNVMKFLERF